MDGSGDQYDVGALVRGSDCQDAVHTLYDYLDGELTPDRRAVIQRHLEQCLPCLQAFDFEAELKLLIAKSCTDQVPQDLRSRILQALSDASNRDCGDV
jgi:mycothiol system anti-sigma-R factor